MWLGERMAILLVGTGLMWVCLGTTSHSKAVLAVGCLWGMRHVRALEGEGAAVGSVLQKLESPCRGRYIPAVVCTGDRGVSDPCGKGGMR